MADHHYRPGGGTPLPIGISVHSLRLKNLIDFAQAVEPLLKTTVPHVISAFDELEQKGLLRLFTKVPAKVDLSKAQEVGLFGLLQALREKEVKQGLGVLLELTRGLSAAKV